MPGEDLEARIPRDFIRALLREGLDAKGYPIARSDAPTFLLDYDVAIVRKLLHRDAETGRSRISQICVDDECIWVIEAPGTPTLAPEPDRLATGRLTVRALHPDTGAPLWRAKADFELRDSPIPPELAGPSWPRGLPDLRGAIEQVVAGFPPDMSQCSRRLGRRCASSDTPWEATAPVP